MAKILVVEDDEQLLNIVGRWLVNEHHTAELVQDGKEALDRLKIYDYDLIILDWGLPGLEGIDINKENRNHRGKAPVLMLTARRSIEDRVQGLDTGADDYLTKPFHAKELFARVNALLRRPRELTGNTLQAGDIELDPRNFSCRLGGDELKLLPKEFALLEFFMRHPGNVFSPEQLLSHVWSDESEATTQALATCIKRLRRKLDPDGKKKESVIRNVHGVGYGLFID